MGTMSILLLKYIPELSTSLHFLFYHPITSHHHLSTQENSIISSLILCLHTASLNSNINNSLRNIFEIQITSQFTSTIFIAPRRNSKPSKAVSIHRTYYLLFLKYFIQLCLKYIRNFRYINA